MFIIVSINPQNIKTVGISEYMKNPKINAAKGSAPDNNIEDIPESIWFKLTVDRIYGNANENVECTIKNNIVKVGSIETKLAIWLKFVKGISATDMNMIE